MKRFHGPCDLVHDLRCFNRSLGLEVVAFGLAFAEDDDLGET